MEDLITEIESEGLMWDIGYTSGLREARIWEWPYVSGRYRTSEREPAVKMLAKAYARYKEVKDE